MSTTFSDLVSLRELLIVTEQREAEIRQRIQQRIGDATIARFDGGEVRWKRSKDGSALDTERFQADHPEIAGRYRIARPGSRRFTIKVHESLHGDASRAAD